MAKTELENPDALKDWVGKDLGASDWVEVTQDQINMFADATGDHQWIHVDVERAKKESPFGGPIAHGYWTVAIMADHMFQILNVKNTKLVVNYGLNKVRFPAPVPIGSKVRAKASVADVREVKGGIEAEFNVAIEVEGTEKPACVAAVIYRYYK